MCLCVRTYFPLPCVCLFLKKMCEIGCTCRIYLRGNISSLTILLGASFFFSLKLSHLLSHSICRFTLGPLPYKNTWKEKCGKLDEVFYTYCCFYIHLWNISRWRAKWPISMNFGNIWAWNTIWEIISYLPLFVVLKLGELEYPLFLIHRGTWHQH